MRRLSASGVLLRSLRKRSFERFSWASRGIFNSVRLKRPSVVRKEFLRVSKKAKAAVKSLHCLRIALENLSASVRDWPENLDCPEKISLTIDALSSVGRKAQFKAEELKGIDKGGAPQMYPFKMLILGLVLAFENATKRKAKVIWNDEYGRYEGDFVRFVETVLPLTRDCASEMGQIFPYPKTPQQRGRYVYDWTRAGSRKLWRGPDQYQQPCIGPVRFATFVRTAVQDDHLLQYVTHRGASCMSVFETHSSQAFAAAILGPQLNSRTTRDHRAGARPG